MGVDFNYFTMKTTKPISEIQTLSSDRLTYNLLLDEKEKEYLLDIQKQNFDGDYIKTLYGSHPDHITFEGECAYHVACKFNRNKNIDLTKNKFYRLYYVIKFQNEIIGTLEVYGSERCVEFGLFIAQKFSRQGFGKEALATGVKLVRDVLPHCGKMKWECYSDNVGSCKVAEFCSFVKDDDQHMYDLNGVPRYGRTYYLTNK